MVIVVTQICKCSTLGDLTMNVGENLFAIDSIFLSGAPSSKLQPYSHKETDGNCDNNNLDHITDCGITTGKLIEFYISK